jgi:hypothetical protein
MASRCITKVTCSKPPGASWNSHDYGLQLCPHILSVAACKFAQSCQPCASVKMLNYGIQVSMIMGSKCISLNSRGNSLQGNLDTYSTTITECISQCFSMMAPKCISKYTRLPRISVSWNFPVHGIRVYICHYVVIIARCTSNWSQAAPASAQYILCVDR